MEFVRGFMAPGGEDVAGGVLPGSQDAPNISVRSHAVVMKKGYGAFGGGGATLEKSKLDLSQSTARVKQEVWRSVRLGLEGDQGFSSWPFSWWF